MEVNSKGQIIADHGIMWLRSLRLGSYLFYSHDPYGYRIEKLTDGRYLLFREMRVGYNKSNRIQIFHGKIQQCMRVAEINYIRKVT